ncbi:MAG: glycosyltransferase family 2 protein [Rhodospirillales bacterium]|nr:glycosyltransferase family 2 protein [Rhodospirillales bacterium]
MATTARLLVVIPCCNEEAFLEDLVIGLLSDEGAMPARIVIADGRSTDRSREIARRLAARDRRVVFLDNPRRIQAAAINLAVAVFGDAATFLVRVDAHACYPPRYFRTLLEEALRTGADSVVVSMSAAGTTWFQRVVAAVQNSRLGNGGSAHRRCGQPGAWVDHGHHALMRMAAFRAIGGYDESFSHNEDAELDTRLATAGFRIWLTGATAITYFPRNAPLPLFRQYARHGAGRARHILKHRTRPRLRQLAPAAVLPAAVLALLAPFSLAAAAPLVSWALVCLGYGVLLGLGARDMRLAAGGPAAMIMHAGWSFGFWRSVLAGITRHEATPMDAVSSSHP